MSDSLLNFLRLSLPEELRVALASRLADLEHGCYKEILTQPLARQLLGHETTGDENDAKYDAQVESWNDYVFHRVGKLLAQRTISNEDISVSPVFRQYSLLVIAIAALQAFVQANVTGPPLEFTPSNVILPSTVSQDPRAIATLRTNLIEALKVDGEAAYKLTPHVELFCLADTILISPPVKKNVKGADWANLRKDFIHQRLLAEVSPTLQTSIYEGLDAVNDLLETRRTTEAYDDLHSQFLLEQATIHVYHGLDKQARQVLDQASKERHFHFALTGALGKRTKWQDRDISQLVVLARSHETNASREPPNGDIHVNGQNISSVERYPKNNLPEKLDLNDDTLLEAISFSKISDKIAEIQDRVTLPSSLASLDPGNQPLLHPVDSIILLLIASAITNTSPVDGLTREETLPYATRVLDGGSSNWQVYTQALLVRSRIEGYRSRTTERGLLQLQALVDQVIAETTSTSNAADVTSTDGKTSIFLPQATELESAPISERMQYVYELCSPTRWELEAELAARWVSLGGLRSALEIYERLEMWSEAALCWAAVEREDKAKRMIRKQLFHASSGANDEDADQDEEKWEGDARDPAPADAPRLYCILGDLDNDTSMWEKAWTVSNNRYARAQRSLGRHYFAANDHVNAAASYAKALKVNQLNHSSWFALGCCLLELAEFDKAVEAFSRTVQLDDIDAEAWSNLAAALLYKAAEAPTFKAEPALENLDDEDFVPQPASSTSQQNRRDALQALKRAAQLKHDNARIWDNLLTVAASLSPPAYTDIVTAQSRIIDLRGATDGEKCIDVPILEHLVRHVVSTFPSPSPSSSTDESAKTDPHQLNSSHGLPRLLMHLLNDKVTPLITTSPALWRVMATVYLWTNDRPAALTAHEKAWRAVTSQSGWEAGTEEQWDAVVEATVDLCDAYESFDAEAGGKGRFKGRSAVRGVIGRGKGSWEGTEGWERLVERLEGLKG